MYSDAKIPDSCESSILAFPCYLEIKNIMGSNIISKLKPDVSWSAIGEETCRARAE